MQLKRFLLRSENPSDSEEDDLFPVTVPRLFLYNSLPQLNATFACLPVSLHKTAGFARATGARLSFTVVLPALSKVFGKQW